VNLNLTNRIFGRLKVVQKLESRLTSGGNPVAQWLCKCSCGQEKIVSAGSLLQGKVKSCGCWLIDSAREKGFKNKTHGGFSKFASDEYKIKHQALANIKERARRRGYESDLEIDDLPVLTNKCPVLGIVYTKGTLKNKDASPSIDRFNTNLPYLKKYKDNLIFVSHRANRIKSNASVEEFRKILDYMLRVASDERESFLIDSKPSPILEGNEAEALIAP
jgi:hypothetical protein